MAADTGLGWAYTPSFNFTDANGSPLTGAPSGGGLLSLYGPGSATTPVAGPSAVSDLGGGDYGLSVAGSILGTAGLYRYTIPTITIAGYTFANQTGLFTVGDVPPEHLTLRGVLTQVCLALGCGIAGTATSNGAGTSLVDTRWLDSGFATNEFVGDEIVLLEGGASDPVRVRVTAFNPASGAFTIAPSVSSGATASGADYLLIRAGRGSYRYDQIRQAIDAALADLAIRQMVTDEVTLTTATNTNRYTLPTSWLDVQSVEINRVTGSTAEYWETFPPADYDYLPDRRLLIFKHLYTVGAGFPLRVTGRVGITPPTRLGALVRVPWPLVVNWVAGALQLAPAQRAGLLVQSARAGAARLTTRG